MRNIDFIMEKIALSRSAKMYHTLSPKAQKLLHDKKVFRSADTYSKGIEKGTQNILKAHGGSEGKPIRELAGKLFDAGKKTVKSFSKEKGSFKDRVNAAKKGAVKSLVKTDAASTLGAIVNRKRMGGYLSVNGKLYGKKAGSRANGIISSKRSASLKGEELKSTQRLENAMARRHEALEVKYTKEGKKKGMAHIHQRGIKTKIFSTPDTTVGFHNSLGVLGEESKMVGATPYKTNFHNLRKRVTRESNLLKRITGKEYGTIYNSKDIKKLRNAKPVNVTKAEKNSNGQLIQAKQRHYTNNED